MGSWFLNLYPRLSEKDRSRERYIGWFLTTFGLLLGIIVIAAILVSASISGQSWLGIPNFITFFGMSLLVGAAGFAGGGFLGFLFGVPRIRTSEGEGAGKPGTAVVSNTNLEQLSDWLTKILVGVTLVQIHKINDALILFRDEVDRSLKYGEGSLVGGAGFACSLILIGSGIAGFLAAYLKSKTDLMHAFRAPLDVVESALSQVSQRLIFDAARGVLDRPTIEPDACSKETAAKLVEFVPPDSDDPDLYQLLGLAHAVLKNFGPASEALAKAVQIKREKGLLVDVNLIACATRALALAGDTSAAKALNDTALPLSGTLTPDDIEHALAEMFAQLYCGGGYDEAIAIGQRLRDDPGARKASRLWLYLASAYGQRHAALTGARPRNQAAITEARQGALEAVQEALRLDRANNEEDLRKVWDPNAAKPVEENDLESLYGDAAFKALLGRR